MDKEDMKKEVRDTIEQISKEIAEELPVGAATIEERKEWAATMLWNLCRMHQMAYS